MASRRKYFKSYNMSRKLQQKKKLSVTVTPSRGAGFGKGYISYIKKSVLVYFIKRVRYTLYIYINIYYYYFIIFNVTNVTRLESLAITGVRRLRYNVT